MSNDDLILDSIVREDDEYMEDQIEMMINGEDIDKEPQLENDGLDFPPITSEFIEKLKIQFPDSVKRCESMEQLFFDKGVQFVVDFIESERENQKNKGY